MRNRSLFLLLYWLRKCIRGHFLVLVLYGCDLTHTIGVPIILRAQVPVPFSAPHSSTVVAFFRFVISIAVAPVSVAVVVGHFVFPPPVATKARQVLFLAVYVLTREQADPCLKSIRPVWIKSKAFILASPIRFF